MIDYDRAITDGDYFISKIKSMTPEHQEEIWNVILELSEQEASITE